MDRSTPAASQSVALGLCGLGRNHHAGAIGKLRQQRRERRGEVKAHRRLIDDVDPGHRSELAAAIRSGHVLVPLDVVLDRRRVEFLAVVKGHALTQVDRQRLVIGRPFVAGGELRHDGKLVIDVEELVAERRKDDAADECPGQRGVQNIRVFGEPDAQCLRRRRRRQQP